MAKAFAEMAIGIGYLVGMGYLSSWIVKVLGKFRNARNAEAEEVGPLAPKGQTVAGKTVRYLPAGCHESNWEPLGGSCELCSNRSSTYFRGVPVCGSCNADLDPYDPRSAWEIFA